MPKSIVVSDNKYFEAKIQLRPYDEEIYLFIEKELESRKQWITKIIEYKNGGVDLIVSSQRLARTIGQKVKRKFKGWDLTITKTLHTRDRMKSKELCRATVLLRKRKA